MLAKALPNSWSRPVTLSPPIPAAYLAPSACGAGRS